MGIKGWLGFHLKEKKISHKLFHSLMLSMVKTLLEETGGNIEEANQKIFNIGVKMAEPLLFEYADKIKSHAGEFHEFSKTLNLAHKVFTGHEFSKITYSEDKKTITYAITDCPLCEGIILPGEYKGLKYCNIVPGIFSQILKLRGFKGTCTEIACKTQGAPQCVYEMKQID
ncbi:MAG: hypothetical protein ACTSQY_10075 [Candidatus Odinarchaeia archaeon]